MRCHCRKNPLKIIKKIINKRKLQTDVILRIIISSCSEDLTSGGVLYRPGMAPAPV